VWAKQSRFQGHRYGFTLIAFSQQVPPQTNHTAWLLPHQFLNGFHSQHIRLGAIGIRNFVFQNMP
jgi:hypothetical protein